MDYLVTHCYFFFPATTLFCFKQSACDNSKCVRIIRENLLDATDKADTLNLPWGEGWKTQLVLLTYSQMERWRSWSCWEMKREGLWSPAERLCPGEGTRWHEKMGSHGWGGWVRLHCWICGSGENKEKQNQGCAENIYQMMQNSYCSVTTRACPRVPRSCDTMLWVHGGGLGAGEETSWQRDIEDARGIRKCGKEMTWPYYSLQAEHLTLNKTLCVAQNDTV